MFPFSVNSDYTRFHSSFFFFFFRFHSSIGLMVFFLLICRIIFYINEVIVLSNVFQILFPSGQFGFAFAVVLCVRFLYALLLILKNPAGQVLSFSWMVGETADQKWLKTFSILPYELVSRGQKELGTDLCDLKANILQAISYHISGGHRHPHHNMKLSKSSRFMLLSWCESCDLAFSD